MIQGDNGLCLLVVQGTSFKWSIAGHVTVEGDEVVVDKVVDFGAYGYQTLAELVAKGPSKTTEVNYGATKDHQFRPNIHRCLELDPKVWAKVFK